MVNLLNFDSALVVATLVLIGGMELTKFLLFVRGDKTQIIFLSVVLNICLVINGIWFVLHALSNDASFNSEGWKHALLLYTFVLMALGSLYREIRNGVGYVSKHIRF